MQGRFSDGMSGIPYLHLRKIDFMTAVIIDDEQPCHVSLQLLLPEQEIHVDVLGSAFDVKSGVELIQAKKPEILFLDIEMPDGTGFDLLERVDYRQFAIIFVTAHNYYAQMAIDFAAMAYLDKPVSREKLSMALHRANERLLFRNYLQQFQDLQEATANYRQQALPRRLAVSNSAGIHYIPVGDIAYLEVGEGCTEIHQADGKRVVVSANLVEYERRLEPYRQFMRVFKSFIVNLEHVQVYRPDGYVVMQSGKAIPVSRLHQEQLKGRLAGI